MPRAMRRSAPKDGNEVVYVPLPIMPPAATVWSPFANTMPADMTTVTFDTTKCNRPQRIATPAAATAFTPTAVMLPSTAVTVTWETFAAKKAPVYATTPAAAMANALLDLIKAVTCVAYNSKHTDVTD